MSLCQYHNGFLKTLILKLVEQINHCQKFPHFTGITLKCHSSIYLFPQQTTLTVRLCRHHQRVPHFNNIKTCWHHSPAPHCTDILIQANECPVVSPGLTGGWQAFISVVLNEIISLIVLVCCVTVLYYLEMFLSFLLCSLTSPLLRYTQNGILHMLDRNKRIKAKPERFQNCKDKFDLVITCEERVYDQVLEGEVSHKTCL